MNLTALVGMSFLAGVATGIGGVLGVLLKRKERNLSLGLGFSSGLMLGVTFLMLIPKSLEASFYSCLAGFIGGSLFFFLLDFIFPHVHLSERSGSLARLGTLIAIGIALHDFPEGFGIGSGYGVSRTLGATLAVAIALHNIPEGIAIAIPFHFSGISRLETILVSFAAGLSTLTGALLAFFFLSSFPQSLKYSGLAFAAGAMFYITVNELIPEAHEFVSNRQLTGLGGLAGMLGAFLLSQIGR